MVIYAEYLFAENFLIGAVILYMSARLGALKTNKKRIAVGSFLCGIFSFVILADNMGALLGTALKLLFSLFLAYIVFNKGFVKGTILIYVVSVFTGGMTIVLLYITKIRGIANNAVVYIGDVSYVNIIFGMIVSCVVLVIFTRLIREKQLKERVFTNITVKFGAKTIEAKALIDSGNFLKEPLSGKPVAVITKSAAAGLKELSCEEREKRYCIVPYHGIGVGNGILEGYRTDSVFINGKNMGSIVLAVYEGEFCSSISEENYQVLLGKDVLTRGVV